MWNVTGGSKNLKPLSIFGVFQKRNQKRFFLEKMENSNSNRSMKSNDTGKTPEPRMRSVSQFMRSATPRPASPPEGESSKTPGIIGTDEKKESVLEDSVSSENDVVVKITPPEHQKVKTIEARTIRIIRWADGTQKTYSLSDLKEDERRTEEAECKTIKFSMAEGSSPLQVKMQVPRATRIPAPKPKVLICPDGSKIRLRQPFKVLTDIWGVLTSYNFRKTLYDYIDANLESYLRANLAKKDIQLYLEQLISRTAQDLSKYPDMPPVITDNGEDALVKSMVDNINYRHRSGEKNLMYFFDNIFNQIWNDGYTTKKLRPHVFPDVIPNFKKWQSDPFFIKIYTFASGPLEIQKLFLSAAVEGDVSQWITSGFDAHHRYKYDTNKYRGVLSSLSERDPENLFYMTDSPKKGSAAQKSGMTVFIVLRDGNRKYKPETLKPFYTINSFDELEFWEFGGNCC